MKKRVLIDPWGKLERRENGLYYFQEETVPFTGLAKNYFENGNLFTEETFLMGEPFGFKRMYFNNGGLESEFSNPEGEGFVRSWYENGNLSSVCKTWKGEQYGESKSFYPSGSIMHINFYTHDCRNGPFKGWHENGVLKSEGQWFTPFPSLPDPISVDELVFQLVEIDSRTSLHGDYREWHPNGKLKFEGCYELGQKIGAWKEWDENGNLIFQTES